MIVDNPKTKPDYRGVDAFFGGPTGLFSKALRDSAKRLDVEALRAQGLDDDVIWKQVTNQCLKLATRNAESVIDSLNKFRVHYQQGVAKLKHLEVSDNDRAWGKKTTTAVEITIGNSGNDNDGDNTNKAKKRTVMVPANHILLATGSKPNRLPHIPFDNVRVFDSDTINQLSFLPKSVTIAGGGIIAIEYARMFRKLGTEVYLIIREESAHLCLERMGMDTDIASLLVDSLVREGIHVYPNTVINEFSEVPRYIEHPVKMNLVSSTDSAKSMFDGVLETDIYLIAVGRHPLIRTNLNESQAEGLGLDQVGVDWDQRGGIHVDKKTFRTSNPNVFATGDVIGKPALASTGAEQAKIAVENMFDAKRAKLREHHSFNFPVGIWTIPEIGYYGYTKDKASNDGYEVEEGVANYKKCLRGRIFTTNDGILKLVFEKKSGIILGCHIMGDDACELIHFGMSLVDRQVSIFDLLNEVFTAVTYHELFKEAAIDGDEKLDFGAAWQGIFQALYDLDGDFSLDGGSKTPSPDDLRKMFEEINTCGTGEVTVDDLSIMFQKLGSNVDRVFIEKIIRIADLDKSGTIDFNEFQKVFSAMTVSRKKS